MNIFQIERQYEFEKKKVAYKMTMDNMNIESLTPIWLPHWPTCSVIISLPIWYIFNRKLNDVVSEKWATIDRCTGTYCFLFFQVSLLLLFLKTSFFRQPTTTYNMHLGEAKPQDRQWVFILQKYCNRGVHVLQLGATDLLACPFKLHFPMTTDRHIPLHDSAWMWTHY